LTPNASFDGRIDTREVVLVFILFCRIGGCLMIMPGFSSPRIPPQVRLFIALSATLALTPVLLPVAQAALPQLEPNAALGIIASELAAGGVIGLMARIYYLALQFSASAIAMFIGIGGMPSAPIEEIDSEASISTLITLSAAVLLFITDQHWELFRGLVASYAVTPIGAPFQLQGNLIRTADVLADAFLITLQLSSPFLIYSILVNFLFGLVNKLVPNIPVYFISLPFVIGGGLFLLYLTIGELLSLFMTAFMSWLAKG
jgi:flagellar biosynthesis protein FliR